MRQLRSENVRLEVYGSPGHFPEYDALVRNLAEALANVSFRGTFPNETLPQVFAGLDVLAIPSLWYENSPLVLLSSFVLKTPVVASKVGSLGDLVEHRKNGLLFEMGNASDLALQFRALLEDTSLLDKLRTGIPEVRTIEQNTEELLEIYSRVKRDSRVATLCVKRPESLPRAALWRGSLTKSVKLATFGAQFAHDLTLLRAEVKFRG